MKSKELREQRAVIAKQMHELVITARKENRTLNGEEQQKFDRMDAEQQALLVKAEGYEREERMDNLIFDDIKKPVNSSKATPRYNQDFALRAFLLQNTKLASDEMHDYLHKNRIGKVWSIPQNTMSTSTGSEGGYTTNSPTLSSVISETLVSFGGVRAAPVRVIKTSTGDTINIPTYDDSSNVGAIISQNTEDTDQDVAFGTKSVASFSYTSKICKVPYELIQDSAFNITQLVGGLLGTRIARVHNTHLTTGNGTTQPEGIVTGATLGSTAVDDTTLDYSDLIELKWSVDPAYRNTPSSGYMVSDDCAKEMRLMVDEYNRPLWEVSLQVGSPDRFDGSPVWINLAMADVAADAKVALFGDFSNFWIRDVAEIELRVANERYFEFRQVGFVAFARMDSVLVQPSAIKYMKMAAAGSS